MNFQEEHERSLESSNSEMLATFEKIRIALRDKSKAEIMEALHAQDSATLRWICQQVALPTEAFEICSDAHASLRHRN